MDLKTSDGFVWTGLMRLRIETSGALVNRIMNLWVPLHFGKVQRGCTTGGFSRRAQLHHISYLCMYEFYVVIRSRDLRNTKQKGYPLDRDVRFLLH
jgi:hypothetical protein